MNGGIKGIGGIMPGIKGLLAVSEVLAEVLNDVVVVLVDDATDAEPAETRDTSWNERRILLRCHFNKITGNAPKKKYVISSYISPTAVLLRFNCIY